MGDLQEINRLLREFDVNLTGILGRKTSKNPRKIPVTSPWNPRNNSREIPVKVR